MTWQTAVAIISVVVGPVLVWWSARRTAQVEFRKANDTRELGLIDRWRGIAEATDLRLEKQEMRTRRLELYVRVLVAHINAGLPPPAPAEPPETQP